MKIFTDIQNVMKKYIVYICMIVAGVWACNTEEVEMYSAARYLFFPDSLKGLDSVVFSFSHYPGETTHDAMFYVALTGVPTTEDLEYKLEVVDSLTTALPEDYELPNPLVFKAGRMLDTLKIRCKNVREVLKTQKVRAAFRIVSNENFSPGLFNHQVVRIIFDNIPSKPLWWTGDIEKFILGEYSAKKFEHFVIATKVNDLTGKSLSEARDLTMKFKVYLIKNNIMEEDGETPMVDGIPVY